MNDFGLEERDIQEEFGKWVAVCFVLFLPFSYYYYYWFFFFFFKLSLSFLFTPAHAGGEGAKRERKMRRLIYGKPGD